VNLPVGGHIDVEGPKDSLACIVFALMHQLEDAPPDRLDDCVGCFKIVPGSWGHGEGGIYVGLDASRRTFLGVASANILFVLEQAKHLNVAVLLIPARP